MVKIKIILPTKYSMAIRNPPNMSQIRFPSRSIAMRFIGYSRITVLSLGYLTEYVKINCLFS